VSKGPSKERHETALFLDDAGFVATECLNLAGDWRSVRSTPLGTNADGSRNLATKRGEKQREISLSHILLTR
jgi:hypothetical protein